MLRPRIVTHNVASVDGRLTIAPGVSLLSGDDRWSAIAGDRDPYAWIRSTHEPEALLEGSGSFVGDDEPAVDHRNDPGADPIGADLFDHYLPAEVVTVEGRRWLAVVDGRGRVRWQFKEWPDPAWAGWHVLVITSRAAERAHLAWLRREQIPYLVAGDGPVDLPLAMHLLASELGLRTIVSTAGGRLNGSLLRAGLVDEVDVEFLPAIIGGRGTPSLFDAAPLRPGEHPTQLRLLTAEADDDGHVRLRYATEYAKDDETPAHASG